jgi:hypothetical protein
MRKACLGNARPFASQSIQGTGRLEQVRQRGDQRNQQQQDNGLHDAHDPRIVVDPFGHRPTHFGFLVSEFCEDIAGRPAGLPQRRGRPASLSRLNDREIGRWGPASVAVGTPLCTTPAPKFVPKQGQTSGSQLRRKPAWRLPRRLRARLLVTFSCFTPIERR